MENTKRELISVVIPFYNEANYFDSCINSVLSQTYSKIEILIINDGSDKIYVETPDSSSSVVATISTIGL